MCPKSWGKTTFLRWRIKKGKNNAQTEYGLLKNHVLPFFLSELNVIDPNEWHNYYEEFKDWLDERKPLRRNTDNTYLSANSKNNIIKALNAFYLYLRKIHGYGAFVACEEYPPSGFRGIEDLVTDEESKYIELALGRESFAKEVYIRLLRYTGMRPNEGLGLHINSVVFGQWACEEKWIGKRLQEAGHSIYGYIYLKDQPASYSLRNKDGTVPRKPLKGKPRIAPEFSRVIPLLDLGLASDLVELVKIQKVEQSKNTWGKNPGDYLLFGFSYGSIANEIRQLFAELGSKGKSLYCFRHTFITRFSETLGGDTRMTERIVGHTDKRMMVRYNKLRQRLENRTQINTQNSDLDNIEIKEVLFK